VDGLAMGVIGGAAPVGVGGRLPAAEGGAGPRTDDWARLVANALGLAPTAATFADEVARKRVAQRLATIAADYILDTPRDALGKALLLTEELTRAVVPAAITFSGGVSEYIFGYEARDYGDIARLLAAALGEELARRGAPMVIDPGQRIRATVIGASQFTVQVSGKPIFLPTPGVLPVHNVRVVHAGIDLGGEFDGAALTAAIRTSLARMDLSPQSRMAIAFAWHGDPDYARIAA